LYPVIGHKSRGKG